MTIQIFNNWQTLWEIRTIINDNATFLDQNKKIKKKTTSAMMSDTITVTDADVSADSWIVWNTNIEPNWFIEVVTSAWSITFNSSATESCAITYYII